MTPDASFGPVFVMAALPAVYFVIRIYKTLLSIRKHEKKNHLEPKRRVWALSRRPRRPTLSLSCIIWITTCIYNKT